VITPDLVEEGKYREVARALQDLRKKEGLEPRDAARLLVAIDASGRALIEKFRKELSAVSLLKEIVYTDISGDTCVIDDMSFVFKIEKIG